ncbi:DUF239 domain-containing protein/DUF4409 domain-containing protein [Cephalotus follicularis]|uniref:DUF239 domain-containing protein/DUF4409 domain-containing protein n=1 Tax=Cephalotus follicularis TaxID=3775 RepID=A0A1Q3CSL7_CEPFO|nr:DUF239 domain-containing protein/DUF4409 domain-containing protein [Cephalotus follicularis]
MASRAVLLVVLASSLLLCHERIKGERTLSTNEDIELMRQLKLMNKPAVQTIRTRYGDIYDCVDFYKQSAFDNILLKNHSYHFQMRPSSIPKKMIIEESSIKSVKIGLKRGCPIGTVPVKRTTKEDLLRVKLYRDSHGSKFSRFTREQPGLYHAIVRTNKPNQKYNGALSGINVYNPAVNRQQYSSGQMKVQNGHDQIQIGWTVNPAIYGDNRTRLFTFWQAGQTSCFDTRCPGFIITNRKIPLGSVISPISKPGEEVYLIFVRILRDRLSGNWWCFFGRDNIPIGYWPKSLFSGLAGPASYIDWGGEAFSPPGTRGPEMGSRLYPNHPMAQYHAFSCDIIITNEHYEDIDVVGIEEFTDLRERYGIKDVGFMNRKVRHVAFWGGTG